LLSPEMLTGFYLFIIWEFTVVTEKCQSDEKFKWLRKSANTGLRIVPVQRSCRAG